MLEDSLNRQAESFGELDEAHRGGIVRHAGGPVLTATIITTYATSTALDTGAGSYGTLTTAVTGGS